MLGDETGVRPRDYYDNPNGRLGANTICNPLWDPLKMCRLLMEKDKTAANIRIIGYPAIDWQGDPDMPGPLKQYLNFASGYSAHIVDWNAKTNEATKELFRSAEEKKKKQRKGDNGALDDQDRSEFSIPIIFGWPTQKQSKWYVDFLGMLCPIQLSYRSLKEPDMNETYNCFNVNLGELPSLTQCLVRGFLFYDDCNTEASTLDSILLKNLDLKWTLAMVKERYYGESAKKANHIATPGCKVNMYEDVMKFIKRTIADGSMSEHNAVRLIKKSIEHFISVHEEMVKSNCFLSDRMTQALDMIKKMMEEEKMGNFSLFNTLYKFQSKIMGTTQVGYLINPYDFARHSLLQCFVEINKRGEALNSGNLSNKIDIMISMVAYTTGKNNESIQPFGRGIELLPCCGTLREVLCVVGQKKVEVTKANNPNSSGKDFATLKINENHKALGQRLGMHSNQGVEILNAFTPTSMEISCYVQMLDGEILTTPDQSLKDKFFVSTESRGEGLQQAQDTIIKYIYTRGGDISQISVTTCKDAQTEHRKAVVKFKIGDIFLCFRCGNVPYTTAVLDEQGNTIQAVVEIKEPGSTVYETQVQETGFNTVAANQYESRSIPLDDQHSDYAAAIAATQILAEFYLGSLNFCGFYLAEINPAVIASLDWVLFFTQKHLDCMFHEKCRQTRFLRLQRVYEARASAFTMWCKTAQYMTAHQNKEVAVRKAIASYMCDALALTDIGGLLYCMVRRCLSWGPILYACCYMIEVDMPIVPTSILTKIINLDDPPPSDSPLYEWHEKICAFLYGCVINNRFCITPNGEFCEYISSNGLDDGTVEESGVLRVDQAQNGWKESVEKNVVQTGLAEKTFEKFGDQLHHACSVSKASLICVIDDILSVFYVDVMKLLGVDIYNVDRLMALFGLSDRINVRGVHFDGDKHPFGIRAVWKKVLFHFICFKLT